MNREDEETPESENMSLPWKVAISIAIIAGILGFIYLGYLVLMIMGKV